MLDLFKKSVYASIGLAVMTREKIEEVGRKIVSDAKMSEAEGREFIDELLKKSDETKASLENMINEKVKMALKKLNIPTSEQFSELECRVRKLEISNSRQEAK